MTYIDTTEVEVGRLFQETSGVTPGSLLHKVLHAIDDVPPWEVHGTSYGFSSIGVPIPKASFDLFNKTISAWVDEKIKSKSDMAALAECGVDMDHPCVRIYTKEEVGANRRFLEASSEFFAMRTFFQVCFIPVSNTPLV